jgi:hypothetical protein
MPKIFELFGYHIEDRSQDAEKYRRAARCPFMECDCDGGGNRYLSHVDLRRSDALQELFPGRRTVASGVCSLQLHEGEQPWIVCPRRLLYLGKAGGGPGAHQEHVRSFFMRHAGFEKGTRLGVWPEVKIKFKECVRGALRSFDYTFDYILVPVGRLTAAEAAQATGRPWKEVRKRLEAGGFSLARRDGGEFVEDFPRGAPVVVEIMTSSTSGGNKAKRTTIPMAFEDAILRRPHSAPGINYRQVWARMVSQLVVKSEVGLAWGGKTFWVLQDVLVDYISSTTALDIRDFIAKATSEVNVLSLSYGRAHERHGGIMELTKGDLYAGPISSSPAKQARPAFQDMIRAPVCPSRERLLNTLIRRKPAATVVVG